MKAVQPLNLRGGSLPSKVDLTPWMPPIKHQKDIEACSANAFASVVEYWVKQKHQRDIEVSRLFLYYNARREQYQDRSVQDAGTSVKHVGDALVRHGFCEEKVWPYRADLVNQKPSREAYEQAKKFTIVPVRMQVTLQNIKTALANRLPTMIGILLTHSAGKEAVKNHGRISKPHLSTAYAQNLQKHAVVCVGFDEQKQHLIVRNSWGEEWGLHGYFYLPYDYFLESRLVDRRGGAWSLRDIRPRAQRLPPILSLHVVPPPEKHASGDKDVRVLSPRAIVYERKK